MTELFQAVCHFKTARIDKLLKDGYDINSLYYSEHILYHPIVEGYYDIVDFLIHRGANVNGPSVQGQRLLHLACSMGGPRIIELMLENGADPNVQDTNGNSALHTAVYRGGQTATDVSDDDLEDIGIQYYLDNIKLLIKYNANINIQNNTGATPLFEAVAGNNLNAVRLLLEFGADVNIPDHRGRLPATIATCNEISDLLQWYENDVKPAIG